MFSTISHSCFYPIIELFLYNFCRFRHFSHEQKRNSFFSGFRFDSIFTLILLSSNLRFHSFNEDISRILLGGSSQLGFFHDRIQNLKIHKTVINGFYWDWLKSRTSARL